MRNNDSRRVHRSRIAGHREPVRLDRVHVRVALRQMDLGNCDQTQLLAGRDRERSKR